MRIWWAAACRRRTSIIKRGRKYIIIAGWLLVWQILAMAVDNGILLAAPLETAGEILALAGSGSFYLTVWKSFLRIAAGFLTGAGAAAVLALGSRRIPLLEEIAAPAMALIKAVPVASFAVILLIWWGSSFLAVAVSFLVVLPHLYINMLEGLKSADSRMLEMARIFGLSLRDRFFYIYRPALKPFLYGGMKVSMGMCWKSGVAAEVIGTPAVSIGGAIYLAKVYLDTAGVLAWTVAVIVLSLLSEKAVLWLLGRFFAWEPACGRRPAGRQTESGSTGAGHAARVGSRDALRLTDIAKSYGGRTVLDRFSAVYEKGQTYYLTGPSGSGKTTLLHILAGLVRPDAGTAVLPGDCSMVFQEDRLCEDYSAVKNVELVTGDPKRAEVALGRLLEEDALHRPCRQLSGGMRRRVALVRAMEADSAYVLLDEPFAGMDEGTCRLAGDYIRERQEGRTVIVATHIFT